MARFEGELVAEELVAEELGVPTLPQLPNERPPDELEPVDELEHLVVLQGAISIGTSAQISIVAALARARPPSERIS